MMPCNNYHMVYTYSFVTFYVKHEYVRLYGFVTASSDIN